MFAAIAANALLAGCAIHDPKDPASRYYDIPETVVVVIAEKITIPPGTAHAKLQDGQAIAHDRLRRYEPFCEIEVNDVVDTVQSIRTGRFAVSRVQRQQQWGTLAPPVLLAANSLDGTAMAGGRIGIGIGSLDDGGAPLVLYTVHLRLKSDEQPNVRELRCAAGWGLLPGAAYPTLAEMRLALGPLIRIEIP